MISLLDVLTPFDPTSYTQLTAAQLEQLVGGVTPYTDKGLIMVSVDSNGVASVPNAANTPKWQNYIWIRVQATTVTCYVWNPNGATDPTYLNWISLTQVSIPPGSITLGMLAPNSVQASNIISIASSQITGSAPNAWLAQLNNVQSGYATNGLVQNTSLIFGDLSGTGSTVASPVIGIGVVTGQNGLNQSQTGVSGKAALGTFTGANIANNSLTTLQMLNNGGETTTSLSNGAIDPRSNIMVPTKSYKGIPSSGNPLSSGQNVQAGDILAVDYNATAFETGYVTVNRAVLNVADPSVTQTYPQVLGVASGGLTYSLQNPQGSNSGNPFGRILQVVQGTTSANTTSSGNLTNASSTPNANATGMTAFFSVAITPISGSSKLRLQLSVNGFSNNYGFVGIYTSTGASQPVGGLPIPLNTSAAAMSPLDLIINSPGTALTTYYVRFGVVSTGGATMNTIDGTNSFGGILQSSLTITEYL